MTDPVPAQRGQARVVITWPRNERWHLLHLARPRQVSHVVGWVPAAVPAPVHTGQTTAVSRLSSRSTPKTISARSHSMRSSASLPCRTRLPGPRAPPPKNASMMSPSPPPKPPANGLPAVPWPDCSGSPAEVDHLALLGSDSTS
jgi:hypothetical protein